MLPRCMQASAQQQSISQCLHSFMILSLPPDATADPSGLQSTAKTSSACPGRSSFSFRVLMSQTCRTIAIASFQLRRRLDCKFLLSITPSAASPCWPAWHAIKQSHRCESLYGDLRGTLLTCKRLHPDSPCPKTVDHVVADQSAKAWVSGCTTLRCPEKIEH